MNTAAATGAEAWKSFERHRAYIVGIDQYGHGLSPLKTATADARRLADVLAASHGFEEPVLLLDGQAGLAGLRTLLHTTMPGQLGQHDRALFYFAGHGVAMDDDSGPAGFVVPSDAQPGHSATMLPMDELMRALDALPCRHMLVILDCCFAGAFSWSQNQRGATVVPKRIYQQRFLRFVTDRAWQVITSAACDQKALDVLQQRALGDRGIDRSAPQHSPFAQRLFEALEGAADTCHPGETQGDGIITATELYLYLRDTVETDSQAYNPRLRQTPGFFPLKKQDKGEFIFLHPRHALSLPRMKETESPYKGLESYGTDDGHLFYGRERVINSLLAMAEDPQRRLIVVTGASGTGKSSVVKAGLLPLLQKKHPQLHRLPTLRPGEDPISALQAAVAGAPPNSLLVIDQLEEVITRRRGPVAEALRAFDAELGALLAPGGAISRVVLTVRADYEPQFRQGALLGPHWVAARYVVPPFSSGELREVVLMPARQATMDFEPPELVDRIVDEVAQAPGALPLLSYALSEMVRLSQQRDKLDSRKLTQADYDSLGGVIGAMTTKADRLYDEQTAPAQALMRRVMLRMVSLEGGLASRRVAFDDLLADAAERPAVEGIVKALVDARLVVPVPDDPKQSIEPAHDALVRAWPRLRRWIDEMGQARLDLAAQLAAAATREAEATIRSGLLWNANPNLPTVEDQWRSDRKAGTPWFNLREQDFIRRSVALKKRRLRIGIGITIGVLLAMGAATVVALRERDAALVAANEALARSLAASAQASVATHPDRALLLAQEAMKRDDVPGAMAVVIQALAAAPYRVTLQARFNEPEARLSADASRLLTHGDKDPLGLWDAATGAALPLQPKPGEPAFVNGPGITGLFAPDGKSFVSHGSDGLLRLWDAATGRQTATLEGRLEGVAGAAFSPDGRSLLARGKTQARIWSLATGRVQKSFPPATEGLAIAAWLRQGAGVLLCAGRACNVWELAGERPGLGFDTGIDLSELQTWAVSPQQDWLVLTHQTTGLTKLLDLRTGQPMMAPGGTQGRLSPRTAGDPDVVAWFSPTGRQLVVLEGDAGQQNELPHLYDLPSRGMGGARMRVPDLPPRLEEMGDFYWSNAAYAPAGDLLATADGTGNILLHDARSLKLTAQLSEGIGVANTLAFSPDGNLLLAVDETGAARVWNREGKLMRTVIDEDGPLRDALFSADSKRLVTMGRAVRIWDLAGQPQRKLMLDLGKDDGVVDVAMSSDARFLATLGATEVRAFDLGAALQGRPMPGRLAPVFSSAIALDDGEDLMMSVDDQRLILGGVASLKGWDIRRGQKGIELSPRDDPDTLPEAGLPDKLQTGKLRLSTDGTTVMITEQDGKQRHWPVEQARAWLPGAGASLSHDGKALLVVEEDVSRLHIARTENPILEIGNGYASFSPDGRTVAAIDTRRAQVRLFDATTGVEKAPLQVRVRAAKNLPLLHFSANGELLLVSADHDQVQVYDLATGVKLREVATAAGEKIIQARMSADGSSIVLMQADNTVHIVACPECKPLKRLLAEVGQRMGRVLTDEERRAFGLGGGAEGEKGFWRRWGR